MSAMTAPIDELVADLPDGTVVTESATTDAYRHDTAAFCDAGTRGFWPGCSSRSP